MQQKIMRWQPKVGKWAEQPLQWIGPLSLFGCPVLLAIYLSGHHGVDLLVTIRAMIALYFIGVVPGYLAHRYVFRFQGGRPFETLLASFLLGTLLTPLVWYAFCWMGMAAIFGPILLALGLALPLASGWCHHPVTRLKELVTAHDTPILWLALLLTVIWSYPISVVEPQGQNVLVRPYADHVFHATIVSELARGVPPVAMPFVAGAKKLSYHNMPDVWCDLLRRAAGAEPLDAYFYLALPIRYLLVCFGAYLAIVCRFGRPAALTAVICLLAFVGFHELPILSNDLLSTLYVGYPMPFGLAGVFLILYYASFLDPHRPPTPLLIASFLSALLLYYKANYALVVAPAVTALAAIVLLRNRNYRWFLLCVGTQALVAAIHQLDMASADMKHALVFQPLAFVDWWWDYTCSMHILIPASLRTGIENLPTLVKWPAIFALCMLRQFHLAVVVGAYLVGRLHFGRHTPKRKPADLLILLTLLFCALAFLLFPVQKDLLWNVCMHLFFLVAALTLALMGPVICDVLRQAIHARAVVGVLAGALICVVCADNAFALRSKVLWKTRGAGEVLSNKLYACYRFIEQSTPPDAVILQPHYQWGRSSAGMITQRRIVLDNPGGWRLYYERVDDVLSDVNAFYAGTSPEAARRILDRYDVDFVVGDPSGPAFTTGTSFLTPVYRNDQMAVFRIQRQTRLSSATKADKDQPHLDPPSRAGL